MPGNGGKIYPKASDQWMSLMCQFKIDGVDLTHPDRLCDNFNIYQFNDILEIV